MKQDVRFAFPAASLALFVVLAILHTWPLATDPGVLSRNDNADTVHHEWIMAWDAHQILHDPRHLFDSNIFYPERDTLAYSDHLIVQAVMAAPLLWSGASPVLAYNLVLIAGFALTGWTTSLVVWRWTEYRLAAVMSGSLMAFNALTLTRLPEIQDLHLEFFPLALAALDCLLTRARVRDAVRLAGWFVLQGLTCGYLLAFTSVSLVAAVMARPAEWVGRRLPRTAGLLLLSAALAVLALTPFLLPYLRVSREHGFTRSLEEVAAFSARLTDYLATGGRLHFSLWSRRFFRHDALFPGVIASGLVLTTFARGIAWKDRRARMALAFGIVACAMSFGPAFPLYEPVSRVFPIMAGIRGAVRFGQLFLAAVAILAGFGLASLQRHQGRRTIVVGLVLIFGAHLEALRAPIRYRPFTGISPVFDQIETNRHEVMACFPFPRSRELFKNVDCMLASTRFWQPLLNGYSSFTPPSYRRHAAALAAFPLEGSIQYLRQLGVTKVIVFADQVGASRLSQISHHPDLSLWKADKSVQIYVMSEPTPNP